MYVCDITVAGDPFETPWRLALRRPNHPEYRAECILVMDELDGSPHVRVIWKGKRHPEDVRALLEEAVSEYLRSALPDDHDLVPAPKAH